MYMCFRCFTGSVSLLDGIEVYKRVWRSVNYVYKLISSYYFGHGENEKIYFEIFGTENKLHTPSYI